MRRLRRRIHRTFTESSDFYQLRKVCGRTLLHRALLTSFPGGPYAYGDFTHKRCVHFKRHARCNAAQFYWPDDYVNHLLEKSPEPWMANHVVGSSPCSDTNSPEFFKRQSIRNRIEDDCIDFDYIACLRDGTHTSKSHGPQARGVAAGIKGTVWTSGALTHCPSSLNAKTDVHCLLSLAV